MNNWAYLKKIIKGKQLTLAIYWKIETLESHWSPVFEILLWATPGRLAQIWWGCTFNDCNMVDRTKGMVDPLHLLPIHFSTPHILLAVKRSFTCHFIEMSLHRHWSNTVGKSPIFFLCYVLQFLKKLVCSLHIKTLHTCIYIICLKTKSLISHMKNLSTMTVMWGNNSLLLHIF